MNKSNLIAAGMFGAVIFAGIGAGGMYLKNKQAIEFAEKYPAVFEIYDYMKDTEIGQPENAAEDVQINSFLKLYDDKYTYYESPSANAKDETVKMVNTSPTAYGCGFKIDFDDENNLYFSDIIVDMPAYEQGFRTGDIILAVDGKNIENSEDAKALMGKKSTDAKLKIMRGSKEQEITLTRFSNTEKAMGVESELMGDILYVKYSSMNMGAGAFTDALKNNNFKSVIIDLRNNPGGEVSTAINSADPFINKAEVRTVQLDGNVTKYETADGIDYDVPIVLLVNGNTASSAEIFTALLKQYADTTIVGTNTFGKGIYQNYAVFNGGYLQYTAGYTEVGDWESYHGKGIAPDVETEMEYDESIIGTDKDIQLQKALEILD